MGGGGVCIIIVDSHHFFCHVILEIPGIMLKIENKENSIKTCGKGFFGMDGVMEKMTGNPGENFRN